MKIRSHKPQDEFEKTTRDIVAQGGQITLPFSVADARVEFSRWTLADLIEAALREAAKPK
jgi:hypothetical protein